MISNRPYLIRAIYEWLIDDGQTPHLLVDAEREGVEVPQQHIQDGKIILNIVPSAVTNLELGNEWISFSARFGGKNCDILLPPSAVLAIYSRENGQGLAFADGDPEVEPPPAQEGGGDSARPKLRVVK